MRNCHFPFASTLLHTPQHTHYNVGFGDFPTDWLDVKESESDAAQSELGNRCVLADLHTAPPAFRVLCTHECAVCSRVFSLFAGAFFHFSQLGFQRLTFERIMIGFCSSLTAKKTNERRRLDLGGKNNTTNDTHEIRGNFLSLKHWGLDCKKNVDRYWGDVSAKTT